ncbi:MAG: hypothetical protein QOG23_1359 [Blastocatellia bacterium]|jgi:hypothetical protein|nr:hypothetical protein [Blastocatellia bacterium]
MADFDWKKFEFITTVQTALISNGINRSLDDDAIKNRHEFSATGVLYMVSEAFRAAEMIPETLTARQAAWEFSHWMIQTSPDVQMPPWFGPPTAEDEARWDRGEKAC